MDTHRNTPQFSDIAAPYDVNTPFEDRKFQAWIHQVDRAIEARLGLSLLDLPDCPYMDWYQDGISPKSAASRAIRMAGSEF